MVNHNNLYNQEINSHFTSSHLEGSVAERLGIGLWITGSRVQTHLDLL